MKKFNAKLIKTIKLTKFMTMEKGTYSFDNKVQRDLFVGNMNARCKAKVAKAA